MQDTKSDDQANDASGACSYSAAASDPRTRRILRHATIGFLSAGYAGTSLEDIALDAGVSKLTIYRLFNDKLGLATAVLKDLADSLGSACGSVIDMDAPPEECLMKFGIAYVRWMTTNIGRTTPRYAILRLLIEISTIDANSVTYWTNASRDNVGLPLALYIEKHTELGEFAGYEEPYFVAGHFNLSMIHIAALILTNANQSNYNDEYVADLVRRKVRLFLLGYTARA
jgi:AcrR family transcriptional regulator